MRALSLGEGEELYYCVPVDLNFDSREKLAREVYAEKTYLAVTGERFLVLEGEKLAASFRLEECEKRYTRIPGRRRAPAPAG